MEMVSKSYLSLSEAYSGVEASLTGHTVVSTVHSGSGDAAHMRIALLCQKKLSIDFNTSLIQAGQAFPIVVYTHKLENNNRKIMDISECEILPTGERVYHTLYRFNIDKNTIKNGQVITHGYFDKPNVISRSLIRKLMQFGVPQKEIEQYLSKEEV
ncbi:hypothetical protein RBG61_12900 [Paludicola sp. MB14-C6]|uniref:hypothetical protein n=1 Tax=Paludihabitans sp. MB14-C6 TaxID=3070656 RepID=UPI0027DB6291|nr:hypothetical protein [Paludicola sp. MB14-C6]WMJ22874.1 hypothetical protein RBG61_12900 [Paludicola sp. MB14-C6]